MANRSTRLILKNSVVPSQTLPASGSLLGEALVNLGDGIMFFSGGTSGSPTWVQSNNPTAGYFEVGSNLYQLKIRDKIIAYSGVTNLSGKFLSGTTSGFALADITDIAASVDSYTTGATWSPNTLTIELNNGKPSVPVTINSFNGITLYGTNTVNGNLTVTGTTTLNGPAYYNNTATVSNEIVNYGLLTAFSQTNDVYVTGNTLNPATNDTPTQILDLLYHGTPIAGPYFLGTENTYTTGGTWNSGTTSIDFTRNDGVTYSVNLSNIDVNDTYVTGGTVTSGGTLDLFRNDNVTVSIPGVTYWTSGSTGTNSIKAINNTGLDATGDRAVVWGNQTLASGNDSTAWGVQTSATTFGSTASGYQTLASGNYAHAEGYQTTASGLYSHSEGNNTVASGDYSHAEGQNTVASGETSHAEGYFSVASNSYSHAEGSVNLASGIASHAEGNNTVASGDYSHTQGGSTTASGDYSHAEGYQTTASGNRSHAEGDNTIASGDYSHASGIGSVAQTNGTFIHSENSLVTGQRSVVLGGQNITGSTNDTVYVPYLNLNLVPTLNNSNTQILSRNTSTGQVEHTPLSAFTSLDTFVTGFTYSPANNTFTVSQNQGQPDLTASINSVSGLTFSNLTQGRVVYVGAGGLLTDESAFTYNESTNTLGVENIEASGNVTIQGDLTVLGAAISAFTSNLYVEDPNITLNYNPTGNTTVTSVNAGFTIQDGNGVATGDVNFDIVRMQNLTGLTATEIPDVTEYTALTGYANRGWITQLNDIVIRSTDVTDGGSAGDINGVRVLAEFDILDGGNF